MTWDTASSHSPAQIQRTSEYSLDFITPIYIKKNPSTSKNDTVWRGKKILFADFHLQQFLITVPASLLKDTSAKFSFIANYGHIGWVNHPGGAAVSTGLVFKALPFTITAQPFPFSVTSVPVSADLFFIDMPTWQFDAALLKSTFNQMEKVYDLATIHNRNAVINELNKYINPMGNTTPTSIYIMDMPYILFVKVGNKIKVTRIEPNRQVPGMNAKSVSL